MADQETQSIIVKASAEDAYAAWHEFERFPHFMQHITSVTKVDDTTSHWVMEGPLGKKIEWDAEMTTDEPGTRIAWNSRGGGDITTSGQATFTQLGAGETEVTVTMRYVPPGGPVGVAVARLFENPAQSLQSDLRRFKEYVEKGHARAVNRS